MARTNTTSIDSMTLVLPAGPVTFNFPTPETNHRSTIIIPEQSKWTTTLHWHETHTEYIRILKGKARVTIGKVTKDYGPEDGDVRIDKFVTHEYMRADVDKRDGEKDQGDVEVLEWTDPGTYHFPSIPSNNLPAHVVLLADGFKEVFFRNVMSIFHESGGKIGPSSGLQLLTTIAHVDNYAVIVPGPVGYYVTHALYAVGSTLGWALGYKKWYEEYTPVRVRAIAERGGNGHLKNT